MWVFSDELDDEDISHIMRYMIKTDVTALKSLYGRPGWMKSFKLNRISKFSILPSSIYTLAVDIYFEGKLTDKYDEDEYDVEYEATIFFNYVEPELSKLKLCICIPSTGEIRQKIIKYGKWL